MFKPQERPTSKKVSPAMIDAGESAIFSFGVEPLLSTAGRAASLAETVYVPMEEAGSTRHTQPRPHSRGE